MALVIGGVIAVVAYLGAKGTTAVEHWVGAQLTDVVSAYLNPKLRFDALDYQYPRTVVLYNPRLTATDPHPPPASHDPPGPGQQVDILSAGSLTLELTEIPVVGEPIRIERLVMDGPTLRLIAIPDQPHAFVGFSDLVKQDAAPKAPATQIGLNDVLLVQLVQLRNGQVIYDPRTPEPSPTAGVGSEEDTTPHRRKVLHIDAIDTGLNLRRNTSGLFNVALWLKRPPVCEVKLNGTFDLDQLVLNLSEIYLELALGRDEDRFLPPQLQEILTKHEVTGRATVTGSSRCPLLDWRSSDVAVWVEASDLNVSVDEYRLPIEKLSVVPLVRDRKLVVEKLEARTLDGQVSAAGPLELDPPYHMDLNLSAQDLSIAQLLRARADNPSGPPKFQGRVSTSMNISAPAPELLTQAAGQGTLSITKGRVMNLPVVADVVRDAADVATDGKVKLDDEKGDHEAELVFTFKGDRVVFSSIKGKQTGYAYRGDGVVYFDSRLDLRFNAGPLELLQENLGVIGDVLGAVTDTLVKYTVTGTLAEPKLGVDLAGGLKKGSAEKASSPDPDQPEG